MAMRGARLPLGSAAWIGEERSSALHISEQEVEEFSFSARNDFDWLNEHMAAIFDENEIDVASIFKTPHKLRAVKTPRSNRTQEVIAAAAAATTVEVTAEATPGAVAPAIETNQPLSDLYTSTTPAGTPSGRFTQKLTHRPNSPTLALVQPNADLDDERDVSPTPVRSSTQSNSKPSSQALNTTDSGYYGSHSQNIDAEITTSPNSRIPLATKSRSAAPSPRPNQRRPLSPEFREAPTSIPQPKSRATSPRPTRAASPRPTRATSPMGMPASPRARSVIPLASSPLRSSPMQSFHGHSTSIAQALHDAPQNKNDNDADIDMDEDEANESDNPEDEEEDEYDEDDDARSGSLSPVRPVMRKSSLNFATLPAREPLAHKSTGARASRTSNSEMLRSSYYPRTTSGKSLGASLNDDEDENNEMHVDDKAEAKPTEDTTTHNMTYTQRLQDQINKLVESQPKAARPSKSLHGLAGLGLPQGASQAATKSTAALVSPVRNASPAPISTTPGAFPRDDDEDWINPPVDGNFFSPNPPMESVGKEFVSKQQHFGRFDDTPGRGKSASISLVSEAANVNNLKSAHAKSISVSTASLTHFPETGGSVSPIKSPNRSVRESPLKHVRNKLSSILKGSRGLLATNATVGADGKYVMSPGTRLGGAAMESTESLHAHPATTSSESLYPDISAQASEAQASANSRVMRATRTSAEREKVENEARIQVEMEKADRARELEREKALRALNEEMEREREKEKQKERERIREQEVAAQREREREHELERERELERQREVEREREAERERELEREREREAEREREQQQQQQQRQWELEKEREREREKALAAKRGPTPTEVERPKSRAALTSPKKIMRSRQQTDDDAMEIDTPVRSTASVARPTTSHGMRTKEIKRPTKPVVGKSRPEPPKHIVVKPTSMYHPSTAALSASLQDTLDTSGPNSRPQSQLSMKGSQGSLKDKDLSSNSLKSSAASSAGGSSRSRTTELAARKREQDEKRRKEVKADMERKRMTPSDETRRLEQRRIEAERIKEEELKAMEAKKKAQRQAAIERAKQTRAPPPAVRSQPNGPPDYSQSAMTRPQSRIATAATSSEIARPKSAMKGALASKRQLDEEKNMMQSRSGPSYQAAKDSKRRRTGDGLDEDESEMQPVLKGPPVRPSSALKKDHPTKSAYGAGASSAYGQAAATPGTTRDIFKNSATKNPNVDMSQFSKGAIPFSSGSAAAPTSVFKTPGRPNNMPMSAKSASKSASSRPSPRFQNGEHIELPEIETDDDDEDDDDEEENARDMGVAAWADSPDLRRALIRQETMDPSLIFGPPAPLNMEEVFNKNKERWNKFRARTSSANWAGGG